MTQTYYDRSATLTVTKTGDNGAARFHASLSSEQPAKQMFGMEVVNEVLRHTDDAINLERADADGLPVLFNHDPDKPVGRVRNIQLVNKRLEGDIEFSQNSELGRQLSADVADGFLSDVSLRYSIQDHERGANDDDLIVTRFSPLEVSLVSIPADFTVGINRSTEIKAMTTKDENDGKVVTADFTQARKQAEAEGKRQGAEVERQRVADIDNIFAMQRYQGPTFQALRAECIAKGSTPDQTRQSVLELIDSEPGSQTTVSATRDVPTAAPDVTAGADQLDKLDEAAERALDVRLNIVTGKDARELMRNNQFADMPLAEMAREYLRRAEINTAGMSRYQIVGAALRPDLMPGQQRDAFVGHGTASFTNLLASTAHKMLLRGFDEAPETWQEWCRTTSTPDFRTAQRSGLSQFDDLDTIPENGEYQHGTMDDRMEPITPTKRGKLFAITREAILADDLNGLSVAPTRMGRAAARSVGDSAYSVLTTNAALNQDSVALFHASHSNISSTGTTPSVASLDSMRVLMALQTDSNSNAAGLNIRPSILLCPVALETTCNVLIASQFDPLGITSATGGAIAPNPFQGTLRVVADPRLDASSSIIYYLLADPNQFDTVEMTFVGGQQSPFLESRDGWTVDGIEYKVRIEAGAAALDFRGVVRHPGV